MNVEPGVKGFVSRPVMDRFWSFVALIPEHPCWEWIGCGNGSYGQFHKDGRHMVAHRASYELFVGEIPAGMTLDHLCRNRRCVNPAHLEPVTQRANTLRGIGPSAKNASKTHCPRGHEYSGDNTYIHAQGYRVCRACTLAQQKIRKDRIRAAGGKP